MTILEAYTSLTSYPVNDATLSRLLLDRGLTGADEYTAEIGNSEAFQLARADLYDWLAGGASTIKEQDSQMTISDTQRELYIQMSQRIYSKYNDPKVADSETYGYVGEFINQ